MAMTNRGEIRCDVRSAQLLRELAERPLPLNLGASHVEHRFFRDVYLDTPDGRLRQFGISCQYRIGGDDRRRLTLFQPTPDAPAETPLLRRGADVDELDALGAVSGESVPARRVRAIVEPESLAIAFTVQTDRLIRRSVRRWLRPAQFEFAYDVAAVEQHGVIRHFHELRVRRLRAGPPSLARIAAVLQEAHGLRPILVNRQERERLTAAGAAREADRRAVASGRAVALVVLEQGTIACRNDGGGLRLPIAAGSGDGACRHLLLECFGSSVGELHLLGDVPAGQGRPQLEIWLVTQTRHARTLGDTTNGRAVEASPVLWLSLDELIARAGTPSLSDASTLAALLVAARSDLSALSRASRSTPVVGSFSAVTARDAVHHDDGPPGDDTQLLDAERSLIEFNARVLAMAEDKSTPLLERVQYLGIVSANVDEFFAVSVAALKRARLVIAREHRAAEMDDRLAALGSGVRELVDRQQRCLRECMRELESHGIRVLPWAELAGTELATMRTYFRDVVFPTLTPQAVTEAPGYPAPQIASLALSVAVVVKEPQTGPTHLAFVRIPAMLARLVPVRDDRSFVRLEDLIVHEVDALYPGREVLQSFLFRVTRSGELEGDDDGAGNLLQTIEEETRRRASNAVVRLEVERAMPPSLRSTLLQELRFDGGEQLLALGDDDVYEVGEPLDPPILKELASLPLPDLHFPPFHPRDAFTPDRSMFDLVRERDRLVHHPYENFATSVQRLIEEAADDPAVTTIKLTLYRSGQRSPIIDALVRAAQAGKEVAVFVELKARFDEAQNVHWARRLANAGIHVVHGLVGFKTHAKIALVVRREGDTFRRYVHVGTGNYNAATARFYTDVGLLSANEALTTDVSELFNELTGSSGGPSGQYRRLLVAPHAMLPALLARIAREAEHARAGHPSGIRAKLNGLADPDVIAALYRASQAGVPIELIVRGICRLRPGAPGLSENIRVVSLLGRFLEHARIYRFVNAGDVEYFIGSADWRPRNLRRRIETVAPVVDAQCRARLDTILDRELADESAWVLRADGGYRRVSATADTWSRAQSAFAAEAQADLAPA
jgi:polyphosphate kinase